MNIVVTLREVLEETIEDTRALRYPKGHSQQFHREPSTFELLDIMHRVTTRMEKNT